MRRAREVLLALLLLLAVLAALLAEAQAGMKFVRFEEMTTTIRPKEGSIINLPVNCPVNTMLIGKKCRQVYGG